LSRFEPATAVVGLVIGTPYCLLLIYYSVDSMSFL
jgi:hypothetical protein